MHERFDYGKCLSTLQNDEQMLQNLAAFVPFFDGCSRVLDLGCGNGHFLRLLRDVGIDATGVDSDLLMAQRAAASGFKVVHSDVIDFLLSSNERFDGVFCSHLVEHLPFERVIDLVEGLARVMDDRGRFVMAFPNPESLDMQLFHFWLDPQHVRFYHPTLIEAMLRHYGFEVVETQFRHWRAGGTWSTRNGTNSQQSNGNAYAGGSARRFARRLKDILGITRLEHEVDYLTRIKSIGEEAVILGFKK